MDNFITLDHALNATRKEVRAWYEHINAPLASFLSLFDFDRRYIRAKGVSVWDEEGVEYFDFLGGYGSVNLGHNHPKISEALEKVADLPKILQATLNPLAAALAENLTAIAPGDLDVCFFSNSGAEAVEAALKTARAATGRPVFVSTENSFHGKTFGALSVSGREKYSKPFQPLLPDGRKVAYGDSDALERALANRDVAAFIVEPVQGEGGVIVPPPGYLKEAEAICRKYGTLLIIDEIQTGVGRTGRFFAFEHEDVQPDIVTIAKSLGGGAVPIGCTISRRKVWNEAYGSLNTCLLHTSTFGNNTLAAAAALATLEVMLEERIAEQAAVKGERFLENLQTLATKHPMIKEIRGKGLMIGIELYEPAKGWLDKASGGLVNKLSREHLSEMVSVELLNKHKIITAYTLNNPNVVRLQPPLIITDEQLDYAVNALDQVFDDNKGLFGLTFKTGKAAIGSIFKR